MDKKPTKIRGTKEAAQYLGVSRSYLAREWRSWANDGLMLWPATFGKAIVFETTELDKVFNHHRIARG